MQNPLSNLGIRFQGRHRCPKCRMPLRAEELDCPACGLRIVLLNGEGDVLLEMVDLPNPADLDDPVVCEYRITLARETAGDMYMPKHLPTVQRRAVVSPVGDGTFAVGYSNMVSLRDLLKPKI